MFSWSSFEDYNYKECLNFLRENLTVEFCDEIVFTLWDLLVYFSIYYELKFDVNLS